MIPCERIEYLATVDVERLLYTISRDEQKLSSNLDARSIDLRVPRKISFSEDSGLSRSCRGNESQLLGAP
jgi:hypothetical protein